MYSISPRPAAATLGVPTFTPKKLHKQLDAVLGKGASGTVYSLRDFPGLATKEILLDGLDQRSIDAARLELVTLPALSHPGILRYHQVIEDGNFIYIVMDRHDGTLECLLIEHKRKKTHVSNRLICSIARQVAGALAYLSSASGVDAKGKPFRGLVHRDLKPINILVAADGEQFILADFGLCKDALRSGTTLAGTKPYMAPETLIYNSTSPASDIWALGVIIYELAALKRPNFLEGKEPKDVFIDGWKPDLSDVKNDFIRGILERIFVLDPEKRLTARELHEMLSPCDVSTDELGAQYMVLQHKCSSLETALNDASARIAILEGDTRTKSEKIITLEEALAVKASEMDSLKSVVVTQEAKVDSLKKDLEAKFGQIDAQSSKVAALEGELQTKSAETSFLKNTIAAQAAEMDVLKNGLVTKSEKIDTLEQTLTVKSAKIDTLEAQCKEHLATTRALEDKIALLAASNPQSGLFLLPRLMRAAHTNSVETVRMLVESGDGIGKRDEQGRTALMHAAQQGHVEPVRLLVEEEQGLQDRNGWTALMHAAHTNHFEVVEILATHECGKRENSNRTALMIAAERGYTEIAAALAPHEKGLTDSSGRTALMLAASNAHTEAVRVLVEHEKGMSDNQNHNALYYALKSGHIEDVDFLIEADDPTDENGVTALMRAAARGDTEMMKLLAPLQKGAKDKDGNTAFIHALTNKHTDAATVLREYEAPSWAPLMCAAAAGDIETTKQHLSDKDKKNNDGDTALIIAAKAGYEDIVELLDPTTSQGVTALMRAANRGDVDTARALIPSQKGKRANGSVKVNDCEIHEGTALMWAAVYGHAEVAKLLVEHEGGVRDKNGWTALMYAAQASHVECIKSLLEKEAGMKDNYDQTALIHAARAGHRETAELLMEHEKDVTGWTMLMCAAVLGDVEMVSQHIGERGQKDKRGQTALILAAWNRRDDAVKFLIKHEGGVSGWTSLICAAYLGDINAVRDNLHEKGCKDVTGKTALMWAAHQGHREPVEILLEHEKCLKDTEGITVFMHALKNKHTDVALLLRESEASSWTPLMCAAAAGNIEITRKHLSERNRKNSDGDTALILAARAGHAGIVEVLDPTDEDGVTALMRAAARGDIEMVELLAPLQRGMKDKNGNTAFTHALNNSHVDAALLLREYEAPSWTLLMCAAFIGDIELAKSHLSDKDKKNRDGDTALIIAAKAGYEDIVELLDPTDYRGVTALMRAAERGDVEAVRALIPLQTRRITNYLCDGKTALMIAAVCGHAEVVGLLVEHEGGMQNNYGWTALMSAAQNGHTECARLLLEREAGVQNNDGETARMLASHCGHFSVVDLLAEYE